MKAFLLFLALLIAPLAADTTPEETKPSSYDTFHDSEDGSDDHFTRDLMQMFATLGLLLAVVMIGTWFLKRMMHTRLQQINTTSDIKILEQRALSPKTILYIVDIHGKSIALAESVNGVTHLIDFSTKEKEGEMQ